MGMSVVNIVMEIQNETDDNFVYTLKKEFTLFNVKMFSNDFYGIIGQAYLDEIYTENDEEYEKILGEIYIDNRLINFSKMYPNKIIGYIEMDCHGGVCFYEGFAVKNGEVIFRQENKKDGHIDILKKINTNYTGPFFEPFTRKFLGDNGYGRDIGLFTK